MTYCAAEVPSRRMDPILRITAPMLSEGVHCFSSRSVKQPVRALVKPGSDVLRGPRGVAMELTAPLVAVRLDFRTVRAHAPTSPGMRGRVQAALAAWLRGSRASSGLDEANGMMWE